MASEIYIQTNKLIVILSFGKFRMNYWQEISFATNQVVQLLTIFFNYLRTKTSVSTKRVKLVYPNVNKYVDDNILLSNELSLFHHVAKWESFVRV